MKEQHKGLILVVDDVADNRDVYAQFLAFKGFKVALAGDGQEALDKAFRLQPDLIVMDLTMPIMDGWEATRRLKGNIKTQHIPVVVLTAHAHKDMEEGVRETGCDGFLTKPCPPDELFTEIVRILNG
jgi:two-component system, cell cycle response regulator DivK